MDHDQGVRAKGPSDHILGGNDEIWKSGNFGWDVKRAKLPGFTHSQGFDSADMAQIFHLAPWGLTNSRKFSSPSLSRSNLNSQISRFHNSRKKTLSLELALRGDVYDQNTRARKCRK